MDHDIPVARVPVGEPVSGERVHVHVDRQQVVAGFDAVFGHVLGEEGGGDPFSHRSSVHVGKGEHDGIDGAVGDPRGDEFKSGHDA